jgi:exonuclease VII large subunit
VKAILFASMILLMAVPAFAETIAPADAKRHVGQTVAVKGVVSEVFHIANGREIFIALGGRYPRTVFRAAIMGDDTAKFAKADELLGKTVTVTGEITLYKGSAEIELKEPTQLTVN